MRYKSAGRQMRRRAERQRQRQEKEERRRGAGSWADIAPRKTRAKSEAMAQFEQMFQPGETVEVPHDLPPLHKQAVEIMARKRGCQIRYTYGTEEVMAAIQFETQQARDFLAGDDSYLCEDGPFTGTYQRLCLSPLEEASLKRLLEMSLASELGTEERRPFQSEPNRSEVLQIGEELYAQHGGQSLLLVLKKMLSYDYDELLCTWRSLGYQEVLDLFVENYGMS